MAGARGGHAADDGEAGDVVGVVFDVAGQHVEVMICRGLLAGDGGRAWLGSREPGGLGGARHFHYRRAGQVRAEPVTALGQGLRFAAHAADVAAAAPAQQAVMDAQRDFGADLERGFCALIQVTETLEGVGNAAVGGVFDGDDAVRGVTALDFREDGGDGNDRHELGALAKTGDRRQVAVGVFGAEVGDAHRVLDGADAAEELAEDGLDGRGGERAFIVRGGGRQSFVGE